LRIYFCVIFRETRHHAQAHITSRALTLCALSLAAKRTQTAERRGDFADYYLLWLLLLRLPVVVVLLLLPQNNLLTPLAFALDSEPVSATRISLTASSLSFIYFIFPPLLETHKHLLCLDYCV